MDIYKCATPAEKKLFINPRTENFFPQKLVFISLLSTMIMKPNKIVGKNIDLILLESLRLTQMIKFYSTCWQSILAASSWYILTNVSEFLANDSRIFNLDLILKWAAKKGELFFWLAFFDGWICQHRSNT